MNEKPVEAAAAVASSLAPVQPDKVDFAMGPEVPTKNRARQAFDVAVAGGKAAGETLAGAARTTGRAFEEVATLVGDLNNDGKVDREDGKIAVAKAKDFASKTADEAGALAKEVAKHDMVKDAAAGAAIGAVVAVPIPLVGPAIGAAFGAIAGVVKNVFSGKRT